MLKHNLKYFFLLFLFILKYLNFIITIACVEKAILSNVWKNMLGAVCSIKTVYFPAFTQVVICMTVFPTASMTVF